MSGTLFLDAKEVGLPAKGHVGRQALEDMMVRGHVVCILRDGWQVLKDKSVDITHDELWKGRLTHARIMVVKEEMMSNSSTNIVLRR